MSLPTVSVSGDAFAAGLGLGAAARRAVHEVVLALDDFAFVACWRGSDRVRDLHEAARRAYPRYLRELEGIAAGAEADFMDIFLWNCRGDLPLAAGAGPSVDVGESCTSLLLPREGGGVIAHNEDGPSALAGHCFLGDVETEEGSAFASFCYPGMLPGHTCAVSARGLVQTINHIRPRDLAVGVPRHFVCRAVLDCASLDAAIEVLGRPDRAGGFHHNLGMAGDPRLLSVEAPPQGCHARPATAPMAHANHLMAPPFADLAQTVTPSSARRQARAEALLAAGEGLSDPTEILFDHSDPELPILRRGAEPDDGFTLGTAIFEIGAGTVDCRVRGDDDGPFLTVQAMRDHIGTA